MEKLSNPKETIQVLQKHEFQFKKKFGQNFLIDPHVLDKIVDAAQITICFSCPNVSQNTRQSPMVVTPLPFN